MNKKPFLYIIIGILTGVIITILVMIFLEGRETLSKSSDVEVDDQDHENIGVRLPDNGDEQEPDVIEQSEDNHGEQTAASQDQEESEKEEVSGLLISEYFKEYDTNWNESEGYQAAIKAYDNYVGRGSIEELISYSGGIGSPRIWYAYIDEDEVPELLLGLGDFGTSGVYIFKYNPDTDEVVCLGEFSSYGGVAYTEHRNRIVSQYGNQGFFRIMVSKIDDDSAVLVGSVIDDDGINYYAGYEVPEGADGSHYTEKFADEAIGRPDDKYLVSAEEFDRVYDELCCLDGDAKLSSIDYSQMIPSFSMSEGHSFMPLRDELDDEEGEYILDLAYPNRTDRSDYALRQVWRAAKENGYGKSYYYEDINGDGREELLIFGDDSRNDGVKIYTYYNGRVIYLGEFGEEGKVQINTRTGTILSIHHGIEVGETVERYYMVGYDKVEPADTFLENNRNSYGKQGYEYQVNGKSVSKDEYDKALDKYSQNGIYKLYSSELEPNGNFISDLYVEELEEKISELENEIEELKQLSK